MKQLIKRSMIYAGLGILMLGGSGFAQGANVTLPNSPATTITATVNEQATISIPAGISFTVNDVLSATTTNGGSTGTGIPSGGISITHIVLNDTKKLHLQISAAGPFFATPTGVGSPTSTNDWAVGDVSWSYTGVTWSSSGTNGSTTTLSSTATDFAVSGANATDLTNTGPIQFTLAAKPGITRAGNYTLAVTWNVISGT